MAKICLDAGHGGKDPGAVGMGRKEKEDVLKLCLRVGEILGEKGHNVYYTRTSDVYESPYKKAAKGNEAGVDLFVSFHRNSAAAQTANGFETLVYANTGKAKQCAEAANTGMKAIGFQNRGTKIRPDLIVLNATKAQAVLFEVGFITSEKDNALYVTKFEEICQGLANAISKTLKESSSIDEGKQETTPPKENAKEQLGHVDCTYQAYTTKWWPPVKDQEDWAGKKDEEPIRYLAVKVSKGSVKGRVYTKKNGWLPYLTFQNGYDIQDTKNGVLGDGTPIQALELYYNTPDGYAYQKIHYRVSALGNLDFYPVQVDNEKGKGMDGYAGVIGKDVDKIQIWIE